MAQSRGSSNNPDLYDISAVMAAFEEVNQVRITLSIQTRQMGRVGDIQIGAMASDNRSDNPEANTLASVNATFLATGRKTLDAAVIHVLYLLDGKLASNEMASAEVKKA